MHLSPNSLLLSIFALSFHFPFKAHVSTSPSLLSSLHHSLSVHVVPFHLTSSYLPFTSHTFFFPLCYHISCSECSKSEQSRSRRSSVPNASAGSAKTATNKDQPAKNKPDVTLRPAERRAILEALPTVLKLHIKRFFWAGTRREKIRTRVAIPLALETSVLVPTSSDSKSAASAPGTPPPQRWFDLTAVVVHEGRSIHSGHYKAYVRHTSTDEWLLASDARVTIVPQEEVLQAQAYLLFYAERRASSVAKATLLEAPSTPAPFGFATHVQRIGRSPTLPNVKEEQAQSAESAEASVIAIRNRALVMQEEVNDGSASSAMHGRGHGPTRPASKAKTGRNRSSKSAVPADSGAAQSRAIVGRGKRCAAAKRKTAASTSGADSANDDTTDAGGDAAPLPKRRLTRRTANTLSRG